MGDVLIRSEPNRTVGMRLLGWSGGQTRNCIQKVREKWEDLPSGQALTSLKSSVGVWGESIPPGHGLEVTKNQTSHLYDPKGSNQAPS